MLLLRGLRLNGESVLLWREYVKMECAFVEGLRRRWSVLGIKVVQAKEQKEKELEEKDERAVQEQEEELMVQGMEEGGETTRREESGHTVPDANEEDEDEATRREILNGALVKAVISNAAKGKDIISSTLPSLQHQAHNLPSSTILRPLPRSPHRSLNLPLPTFIPTHPPRPPLFPPLHLPPIPTLLVTTFSVRIIRTRRPAIHETLLHVSRLKEIRIGG